MKYLIIILAFTLSSCSGRQIKELNFKGNNMHAKSGVSYLESFNVAKMAPFLACEWPEEYPGSEDDGVAYRESVAAAEDSECHEDSEEQ